MDDLSTQAHEGLGVDVVRAVAHNALTGGVSVSADGREGKRD
jgi:hypothetical protein